MDDAYIAIVYVTNDHLSQTPATEVAGYVAAVGTGHPPPLVLNLEPEAPQRFLGMYIQCVGTSIVISFFNKVENDWIKKGSAVQVRLPSASSMVPGATQQARIRGTVRWMLECGLQQVEMALAITELRIQYEAALSGSRQSHASSSRSFKCILIRPSYTKERKDMIIEVQEQVKWGSGL